MFSSMQIYIILVCARKYIWLPRKQKKKLDTDSNWTLNCFQLIYFCKMITGGFPYLLTIIVPWKGKRIKAGLLGSFIIDFYHHITWFMNLSNDAREPGSWPKGVTWMKTTVNSKNREPEEDPRVPSNEHDWTVVLMRIRQ
jgi:hypothetical protein